MAKNEIVSINPKKYISLPRTPQLHQYVMGVIDRREFILEDARSRIFEKQRDFRFSSFWIVAQPFLDAAIYGLIFGLILQTSRGVENYVGFIVIGTAYFAFVSRQLQGGIGLIKNRRSLVVSFNFPTASLVLSQSLRNLVDTAPALVVSIFVALIFQLGKPLSLAIGLVPLLVVLMYLFSTGIMFIIARFSFVLPDIRVPVEVSIRALFFGAGIFFPLDRIHHVPAIKGVLELNPIYVFIQAVRDCVLLGRIPAVADVLYLTGFSIFIFFVGFVIFWRGENRYADVG